MKTIGLSEQAYERLAMVKRPGESFNEAILRLTCADWLSTFAGALSEEEGETLDRIVREGRERANADAEGRTRRAFR